MYLEGPNSGFPESVGGSLNHVLDKSMNYKGLSG